MLQQHPGAKAHGASPLHKLAAKAAPIVYYYMPQKPQKRAAMHPVHKVQMLNDTDAAGGDAAGDAFVCTVDNIKALSATVQGEWDKCKDHKDYKEPNAGASRRLLGWVWEPDHMGEKKTRVPAHLPNHYRLKLDEGTRNLARNAHHQQLAHMAHFQSLDNATNGTDAAGGGAEKSFEDCEKEAAEKACAQLAGCAEPVCENYYNEPEIEALCGICTMVRTRMGARPCACRASLQSCACTVAVDSVYVFRNMPKTHRLLSVLYIHNICTHARARTHTWHTHTLSLPLSLSLTHTGCSLFMHTAQHKAHLEGCLEQDPILNSPSTLTRESLSSNSLHIN